ncbi:thioredoxin domain-containing protein [Chelatococcus sp. GCM10030263]|uniref:thioredoxin domain-containing protein n=1 Tax=Chelatococcus sp. GCM10030263 TaxID=3273387 RepID=UPI003610DF6C
MNRLGGATSPYLLQHRDNPVAWWPWGEEALAEARRTGKPILLSIGYAACHWCHVMAHESFEDEATAAVMNDLFVNIKVDREERPDVDHIYMSALQALGEQGGWPLTMFLTPEGEPFWGGTYFPKEARFGRPPFVTLLREIARLVQEEPGRVAHNRQALLTHLRAEVRAAPDASLGREWLDQVGQALARAFDPVNGGLKGAPKFPNAPLMELLWRHGVAQADSRAEALVYLTLEQMARGGIHDHLGGGFSRYSVDEIWLVPHFEKMLYDNAQLLPLYALAAVRTGQDVFSEAAEGIVTWLLRDMAMPEGAFAASLDADTEGEEGLTYVWSKAEIDHILGPDSALFSAHYDVTPEGNWEGHIILNRRQAPETDDATRRKLAAARQKLLAVRQGRPQPGRDDKILADWNGLMIGGLARASLMMNRPDWLEPAKSAYRFVRESMSRDGLLGHSWRDGRLLVPGFASDHAAMAIAALALLEATGEAGYLEDALHWTKVLQDHFADESAVLFMVADSAAGLVLRPQPTHDDAVPNANGLHAEALVRLAELPGTHREDVDKVLATLAGRAREAPFAHGTILNALDLRLNGASIVVAGKERAALMAAARTIPYPNRTLAELPPGTSLPEDHPAAAQIASAGEGAAFVCVGDHCSLPLTDPAELQARVAALTAKTKPAGNGG